MNRDAEGASAIIRRMQELRSTGRKDVSQLHVQAGRVTDWREHVRAQPILSLVAATLVGFTLVKAVAPNDPPSQSNVQSPAGEPTKTKSASRGMINIATGMAAAMARQWLHAYIKQQIGVYTHAAHQSANSDQRTNVTPTDAHV